MTCFVIAEAGVNHNGDIQLAKELVRAAVDVGADAVKFQTFTAEKLVNASAEKAEYQKSTTGHGSQFQMLKALELNESMHIELMDLCVGLGIEFMSTGFDEESIDFLVKLGVKRLKIPSGEITNFSLLTHMAKYDLPMILSTGMSDLVEVDEAIVKIQEVRNQAEFKQALSKVLTILHCTSNYPADFSDVNLRALNTLSQHTQLPVGYSDHTAGILIAPLAVALGATVIEKHFTLDKSLPGPDHLSSLEPNEFKMMMTHIRQTELSLGDGIKAPRDSELPVRDLVRRSVTIKRNLKKGSELQVEDLELLRPGSGIEPKHLNSVIGKAIKIDLQAGTTLRWEDLI
ncbi:MAG: N-acetylneuraminate synthase [Proteobacteria bacterium]|nr:N-acetylneuraminate synthase [Pseudomonadota bacterium]